jgi:hypothetical protein
LEAGERRGAEGGVMSEYDLKPGVYWLKVEGSTSWTICEIEQDGDSKKLYYPGEEDCHDLIEADLMFAEFVPIPKPSQGEKVIDPTHPLAKGLVGAWLPNKKGEMERVFPPPAPAACERCREKDETLREVYERLEELESWFSGEDSDSVPVELQWCKDRIDAALGKGEPAPNRLQQIRALAEQYECGSIPRAVVLAWIDEMCEGRKP